MIWLILILGFILRLLNLNQSLWLDEAIGAEAVKNLSLNDLLTKYSTADFHPPGYNLFLWFWTHSFGFTEIVLRLPSVIFGVLTILLVFLTAKKLFSYRVGFVTATLLSFNPLHIYYSQEARMYSFAAFAVCLSIYFLSDVFSDKKFRPAYYFSSIVLIIYSDYVSYLAIIPQVILILFYFSKNKRILREFLTALILGMLSFLPFSLIFLQQLQTGQLATVALPNWKSVVGGASLKDLLLLPIKMVIGRISFDNKFFYGAYSLCASFPILLTLLRLIDRKDKKFFFLVLNLFMPVVVGILVSLFLPIFTYFRFLFLIPVFCIIIALGLEYSGGKVKFILFFWILFFEISSSFLYLFNPRFHREDWRDAVLFVSKIPSSDIVLFEDNNIPAPYRYYAQDLSSASPGLDRIPADVSGLDTKIKGKKRIYLFEYLGDINDPNRLLPRKLQMLGYSKRDIYNFNGVGFIDLYQL